MGMAWWVIQAVRLVSMGLFALCQLLSSGGWSDFVQRLVLTLCRLWDQAVRLMSIIRPAHGDGAPLPGAGGGVGGGSGGDGGLSDAVAEAGGGGGGCEGVLGSFYSLASGSSQSLASSSYMRMRRDLNRKDWMGRGVTAGAPWTAGASWMRPAVTSAASPAPPASTSSTPVGGPGAGGRGPEAPVGPGRPDGPPPVCASSAALMHLAVLDKAWALLPHDWYSFYSSHNTVFFIIIILLIIVL